MESGSSAETQGIRRGDILTSLNGRSVTTLDTLEEIIFASTPGDKLTATIVRNDREYTVTLTVDEEKH